MFENANKAHCFWILKLLFSENKRLVLTAFSAVFTGVIVGALIMITGAMSVNWSCECNA